jgi:hypothetical protein
MLNIKIRGVLDRNNGSMPTVPKAGGTSPD